MLHSPCTRRKLLLVCQRNLHPRPPLPPIRPTKLKGFGWRRRVGRLRWRVGGYIRRARRQPRVPPAARAVQSVRELKPSKPCGGGSCCAHRGAAQLRRGHGATLAGERSRAVCLFHTRGVCPSAETRAFAPAAGSRESLRGATGVPHSKHSLGPPSNTPLTRGKGILQHNTRKSVAASCNRYEAKLLADVLPPEHAGGGFADVGALGPAKEALREAVQLPLAHPQLFTGPLVRPMRTLKCSPVLWCAPCPPSSVHRASGAPLAHPTPSPGALKAADISN